MILITGTISRKNADACHAGGIGNAFDEVCQKCLHAFERSKDAGKTEHGQRRRAVAL